MKVLITIGENEFPNPYIRTLADSMRKKGIKVTCSSSEIWNNWEAYDIIHVQWPQVLLRAGMLSIEPLKILFSNIKKEGKVVVATCHNMRPHYSNNHLFHESYEVVYNNTDYFVHLGEFSKNLFEEKYPDAKHVVIPHHIYDNLYNADSLPNRQSALKKLGLSDRYRYVLCMGAFRNEEEINLAQYASDYLAHKGFRILAPALYRYQISYRHPLFTLRSYLNFRKAARSHSDIICNGRFVSDKLLPYYYAASDLAFIHRKEILNSGNVPMAMLMGKVIVGPDTGNVGILLHEIDNPVFNPVCIQTLESAFDNAIILIGEDKGRVNQKYAVDHFSSSIVASEYDIFYHNILLQK